ncbi:MAG: STAS domain-containing protein [Leptospiraceae bacterium]|nr:STAS domain-containing protein [Leptospiraceae bacterium]
MSEAPNYIMEDLPWDNSVVFRPRGSLDIYTAPEFRAALDGLKENGRMHFILDLSGIEYIDSTGLGSLASFMDKVKKDDGSLRLAGLQGVVHKAFVFTNLLDLFNISATVEEAIESLADQMQG